MKEVTVRRILQSLFVFFLFLYPIPYTLYPVHAACTPGAGGVQIEDCFGFGNIGSLGEGTTRLVGPIFQFAAVLVVIYFLLGAFKFLRAGGNKEEVEEGKQMITHAIIGFIILMLAFLILQFLLSRLFDITNFKLVG